MLAISPSLRISISNVIRRRAKKEMVRVAAPRVVTTVADEHSVRDGAVMYLVGEPMHLDDLATELENAVSVSVAGSDVFPAALDRSGWDKAEESFSNVSSASLHPAINGAVFSPSRPTGERLKADAAPRAIEMDSVLSAFVGAESRGCNLRRLDAKRLAASLADTVRGILGGRHGVTPNQSFYGAVPREVAASPGLSFAISIPRIAPLGARQAVVNVADMQRHISAEHPRGTLAFSPILDTPLGEV